MTNHEALREILEAAITNEGNPSTILRFFRFHHLPEELKAVSAMYAALACNMCITLPNSAERTVALRKLLESKDCAVRAMLP